MMSSTDRTARREGGLPNLNVRENGDSDPEMVDDYPEYTYDAGFFEQLSGSILTLLRSYRFVYSLDNEANLEELILKLDNIRLRFAIWLRVNHGTTCDNYQTVMEVLAYLDSFLLNETETILKGRAHGLKHYKEAGKDGGARLDKGTLSPLHTGFQYQMNKYLRERDISGFMTSIYYAWIVVDYTDCLSFLATIDTLLEDLLANTSNQHQSTLIHDYAYSAIEAMPNEQLNAIALSGFSDENMICQAAELRCMSRESGNNVLGERASGTVKEGITAEEWLHGSIADTDSIAGSSSPIFTPTTSEAPLDVQERFALIADRAKESRDLATTQVYPDNQLNKRRILAELQRAESAPPFATVACIDSSISDLLGIVAGPPGTPYENGIFFIRIKIPGEYPLVPANVSFVTKIYHPNIDWTGQICVVDKYPHWSINCSVWGLLTSIYSLLANPNVKDTGTSPIKAEYTTNRGAFETTAREWTERFANRDWPSRDGLSSHVPLAPTKTKLEKGRKPGSGGVGEWQQHQSWWWTRKSTVRR